MIKKDINLAEGLEDKAYFIDPLQGLCVAQGKPEFLLKVYNDYKAKQAKQEGFINSPTLLIIQDEFNHDELMPFHPSEVVQLHRTKYGQGWGFWYRLHDGRVFDSLGKETDNSIESYTTNKMNES